MQVLGIFKWKKHLKADSQEIEKEKLSSKERVVYISLAFVFSVILAFVLWKLNDQSPIIDAVTSVFSIIGLILTVKRCVEQWYIWLVVNGLSTMMWIQAYLNGSNCFATILMWATYFVLSIYFLHTWNKEMRVLK
jgi:nicotinamide mononucleotide transporter